MKRLKTCSSEEKTATLKEKIINPDYLLTVKACTSCLKPFQDQPIILCEECDNNPFCIECFPEKNYPHEASHNYHVLDRFNYPIYSMNWSIHEEVKFMKQIETSGVDNWLQIAAVMESKTAEECEAHYYTVYYKSASQRFPLPTDIITVRGANGALWVDVERGRAVAAKEELYLKNRPQIFCDEEVAREEVKYPAKCIFFQRSIDGIDIADAAGILGYMPLRGDFNIEYDNEAEKLLAEMEFFEDDKEEEVKIKEEILKHYNSRLDERIRRKKFVIEKGLLEPKKPTKTDREKSKEEKEIHGLMRPFMRFCEGNEFNELVEGLIKERALRKELDEMRLYKSLGLPRLEQIDRYLERKPVKIPDAIVLPKKVMPTKKKIQKKLDLKTEILAIEQEFCEKEGIPECDYFEIKKKITQRILESNSFNKNLMSSLTTKRISLQLADKIYDFLGFNNMLPYTTVEKAKPSYYENTPWK